MLCEIAGMWPSGSPGNFFFSDGLLTGKRKPPLILEGGAVTRELPVSHQKLVGDWEPRWEGGGALYSVKPLAIPSAPSASKAAAADGPAEEPHLPPDARAAGGAGPGRSVEDRKE